ATARWTAGSCTPCSAVTTSRPGRGATTSSRPAVTGTTTGRAAGPGRPPGCGGGSTATPGHRRADFESASHQPRPPPAGDGRRGQAAELVLGRRQVLPGVQGLLPGDDLAGVGGHAAHDGQEAAVGHPLAVVDGLAGPDAGEQLVVLVLVHVVLVAGPAAL